VTGSGEQAGTRASFNGADGISEEILTAMDKLTPDELRILKLGVDSRLADDDDDPALQAALHEAIAYADAHPGESKSIDEVRAAHSKMDFRVEITEPAINDLAEIVPTPQAC
jgi:hypothetical protein